MALRGTYILYLYFPRPAEVEVGGLGAVGLLAGTYAYVGSAMAGIHRRVSRHLRPRAARRWHIDYITPHAQAIWATRIPTRERMECFVARQLYDIAKKVVKGFGAGDCSCPSHLVYLGESSIRRTRSYGT